ncbi:MAG: hypothetical protein JWP88_173 [Flaviaesturariibacter sp.]|nr:hypothetical protein [Flaviaesturariibacter sp.]
MLKQVTLEFSSFNSMQEFIKLSALSITDFCTLRKTITGRFFLEVIDQATTQMNARIITEDS